jgi:hypothetical protein
LIFESTLTPDSIQPLNINNMNMLAFIAENWLSPVGDSKIDLNQSSDESLVDMNIFGALANQDFNN